MENFLAYIDPQKCIACRKCITVCPTGAILANWEPPKPKTIPAEKEKVKVEVKS